MQTILMATKYYPAALPAQALESPSKEGYNVPVGYLRAFLTLLVLAHHSILAYCSFAPPPPHSLLPEPRWWEAFPVTDTHRWPGFDLLVAFNDVFFMSAMFLISGLFVWGSLQRKGTAGFLRDRSLRLGIPFLLAAAIIPPLAYFPTYLTTGAEANLGGFFKQWLALGQWPAGPAWFVWLLLAFDCAVAIAFLIAPKWGGDLGRRISGTFSRPASFFGLLVVLSAVAYIPMSLAFNALSWTTFGPFAFQTSRLFLYALYFLLGVALGAWGIERGLLRNDGRLAQHWLRWLLIALLAFALDVTFGLMALSAHTALQMWTAITGFAFVLSCAASTLAFVALFGRFAVKRVRVLDSIRDNAYGMYLIHYAFAAWLQYLLLRAALPGIAKGSLVFAGTVLLSWGATAALRSIPVVRRVL
jgi:acyltransferase-like protein